jgi:hypothetical protein
MDAVTEEQLAALRAIAGGRLPQEEVIIAKLRRKGLIQRNVFDYGYQVTDEGRAVLASEARPMIILSGESLYEAARFADAARWDELDETGKAIWRDAEQLISDRLSGDASYVTVKFSKQLVEQMGDWGAPIECKMEARGDGTAEMLCRYPGGEIPDKVAEAARKRAYGVFVEDALDDAREIVKAALMAWRP